MDIIIGSDHAGYSLKEIIKKFLLKNNFSVVDVGTSNTDSVDYPDFSENVANRVADNINAKGIIICGSGIGASIAANKVNGVRAALCRDTFTAELSRKHNDSNILIFGSWFTPPELASQITKVWLSTPFESGRHEKRIQKISELEKKQQRSKTEPSSS